MHATDFTLRDQNNNEHTLNDYRGKWVVVYFYPKDDTPGCTKEACGFRDAMEELEQMGVVILGISKDSIASHKKFADKYSLKFPLLSDENADVIKAFNAWGPKKFMGKEFLGVMRKTYLINPEGEIAKTYDNVNPTQHADEIIKGIRERS